ncbi:MAG: AI-2E family transporter [Bacteroidota bacterium]
MLQERNRFTIPTTFFIDIIGIVVIFIVLKELQQIFIPLVLAYFLFFVFSPVNRYLEKNRVPVSVAVILDLLIVIFVVGSFSSVIIDSLSRLGAELPLYEIKLDNIVSSTAASWGIKDPYYLNFHITEILNKVDYQLLAGNLFTSTFSLMGYLFFVLFFFIFVVTGHEKIYEAIKKRYKSIHAPDEPEIVKTHIKTETVSDEGAVEKVESVSINPGEVHEKEGFLQSTFNEITDQVQKYIFTKFIMSLVMGLVIGIILLLFGVDFVIIWAVITFMLHFIPNIGSIIAVALPCLMALVQYESFGFSLMLAAILVVVQNVIGSVIEPKVFGNRLGINPLIILLSLLLWGYIWGIVGAILSVPLTAILKIIISRSDSRNLQFLSDLMSN